MAMQDCVALLRAFMREIYAENRLGYEEAKARYLSTGDNGGLNWIGHLVGAAATLYAEECQDEDLALVRKGLNMLFEAQEALAKSGARFSDSGNLFVEALKKSGYGADAKQMPVIESVFTFAPLLKGLYRMHMTHALSLSEWARLERLALPHVLPCLHEVEWGAHNRCALRAVLILLFARLFPDNPISPRCEKVTRRLMEQCFGRWSMEDAGGYQLIFLNCMCEYMSVSGEDNLAADALLTHYAAFYASILMPDGGLPEFGDSQFDSGNFEMQAAALIAFVAARHLDGRLQYAAERLLRHVTARANLSSGAQSERGVSNLCWWRMDDLQPEPYAQTSCEALEDLVAKKIVLRGENADEHYLFYNYRDMGPYARLAREYLMNSIPVHAEKPHHGHADEQSIAALCAYGSVLLRDGGYRDGFTMDAHYRGDFYHNRLVARRGRRLEIKGMIDCAMDIGDYNPVRTEKLFFERFSFADALRTRLLDDRNGVVCDRGIIFLPQVGCYVVVDDVRPYEDAGITAGPLFFSEAVEPLGDGAFRLAACSTEALSQFWNRKPVEDLSCGATLLVKFLGDQPKTGVEPLRRNYHQEYGVSQYESRFVGNRESLSFVTLLIPEKDEAARERARALAGDASFTPTPDGRALTVTLRHAGCEYVIGWRHETGCGIFDLNHRPTYDFEHGRARHGAYDTDATLLIARESGGRGDYAFVEATRLERAGVELFASKPYMNLQLDYSRVSGAWSLGSFEDSFAIGGTPHAE